MLKKPRKLAVRTAMVTYVWSVDQQIADINHRHHETEDLFSFPEIAVGYVHAKGNDEHGKGDDEGMLQKNGPFVFQRPVHRIGNCDQSDREKANV